MKLESIDIQEFRNSIYPEYEKLFPENERKSYQDIKTAFSKNITDIIAIIENDEVIGFMIANTIKDNPYVGLDYFAIFSDYQGKGYGTRAIQLLKEKYKEYKGIFIEIEKSGLGKNEEENAIREKRAKFYERIGFFNMQVDVDLYKVIYSIYMLPCIESNFSKQEVIEKMFEIYNALLGERRVKENCRVL